LVAADHHVAGLDFSEQPVQGRAASEVIARNSVVDVFDDRLP
jgi:hypothetical protein